MKAMILAVLALGFSAGRTKAELPPFDVEQQISGAAGAAAGLQDRSCADVSFGPNDSPVSEKIELRGRQDCRFRNPGGWECWPPVPHRATTQVILRGRQTLFPWEYDAFQVCLNGLAVGWRPLETAYEYKREKGGRLDDIVLSPVKKIQMNPDPEGLTIESLSPKMVLILRDKWAAYYAGEQTVVKVKLGKSEKEFILAPAPAYTLELPTENLTPGKGYRARVSFIRRGAVSRQKEMNAGKSPEVVYQPGFALTN